jgi:hypothetical protein
LLGSISKGKYYSKYYGGTCSIPVANLKQQMYDFKQPHNVTTTFHPVAVTVNAPTMT